MGKIIISKINNYDILFLFNDNHEVTLIKCIENTLVDSIYKGKIVEINEGLHACFVSVSKDQNVFLSLDEFDQKPVCGTELLIQIKTDPLKTKLPQGTTKICLPGQFCVCHLEGSGISASKKLNKDVQEKLSKYVENLPFGGIEDFRWVVRTNAELLSDDLSLLDKEISNFLERGYYIKNQAMYRSLYSLIYSPESDLLKCIGDIPFNEFDSIVTDNPVFYDEIIKSGMFGTSKDIKLYADEYISLKNLHSLETYLNRAIDKKVYLDCGGYLVIEPTEAMTVIDVNSGKAEGKKKDSATYIYKVNKQAAVEVAKQLKIRNISGIIIVDFVNMSSKEDNSKIMNILETELRKDRIQTTLVDMTPLGLVEITRKKVSNSLDKAICQ